MKSYGYAIGAAGEAPHGEALRADERFVMETEFRVGLREYLATRDADVSVRTLEDLIEFNTRHEQDVLKYFGQELLMASQQRGELDSSVSRRALARCSRFSAGLTRCRLGIISAVSSASILTVTSASISVKPAFWSGLRMWAYVQRARRYRVSMLVAQ